MTPDESQPLQYGDAFFVLEGGRLVAEAESAERISRDLIERVFRVRAHPLADPETGQNVWRFAL
jgi:ABC-type cobalamin/Fe3+-siderophores transport system ATPase subunit